MVWATSRGFFPTIFEIFIATLQAKSPCDGSLGGKSSKSKPVGRVPPQSSVAAFKIKSFSWFFILIFYSCHCEQSEAISVDKSHQDGLTLSISLTFLRREPPLIFFSISTNPFVRMESILLLIKCTVSNIISIEICASFLHSRFYEMLHSMYLMTNQWSF